MEIFFIIELPKMDQAWKNVNWIHTIKDILMFSFLVLRPLLKLTFEA